MRDGDIGILIRTYDRYIDNLGPLLDSLSGYYTVVGYDKIEAVPPDIIQAKGTTFFIHNGTGSGWERKQEGDRVLKRKGTSILSAHVGYILSITGDVVIEKPESIPLLIDALGDNDLIGTQWWDICGDLIMFGKAHKMHKVFCDIPPGGQQCEKKMMDAFHRNSINYGICHCRKEDRGLWGELIGYRRGNDNYPPG